MGEGSEGAKLVMSSMLAMLFWGAVKLILVALGILYAGLVLVSYWTEGSRPPLRLDLRAPARSIGRLLIRLGVKAVAVILRLGKSTLDMLSEASADVGEWYIRRRGAEAEAAFRSRFL